MRPHSLQRRSRQSRQSRQSRRARRGLGNFAPGSILETWERARDATVAAYFALEQRDCFEAYDQLDVAEQAYRELAQRGQARNAAPLARRIAEERTRYQECLRLKRGRLAWLKPRRPAR